MMGAYNLGASMGNAMNQAMAAIERQAQIARIKQALSLNQQGVEAYNQGDYARAAIAFQQASRLSPNDHNMRNNVIEANKRLAEQRALIEQQQRQQMAEARARVDSMLGNLQEQFAKERSTLNAGLADATFVQPSGTSFFGLGGGPGTPPVPSKAGDLSFVGPNESLFSKGTKYSAPVDLRDTASDQFVAAGPIGTNTAAMPVDSGGGLQFVAPDAKVAPSAPLRQKQVFTATVTPPAKSKLSPSATPETIAEAQAPAGAAFLQPKNVHRLASREITAPGGPQRTCQDMAAELAALQDATRRAVLAEDVYKRYAQDGKDSGPDMPGFYRISDSENEMRKLFPGMNKQSIQEMLHPDHSDYRAAIYRDKKDPNKIFLAFRGTVTKGDFLDANIPQGTGKRTEYYAKAIALAKLLKKSATTNGLELEIVGHSLGGGMANAAGAANKIRTTSFNPAGVHQNTLKEFDVSDAKTYVTNYVVKTDPLNSAQDHRSSIAPIVALGSTLALPGPGAFVGAWAMSEVAVNQALPSAIGQRETLVARPQDVDSPDPFKPHYMATVRRAIAERLNEVKQERTAKACAD